MHTDIELFAARVPFVGMAERHPKLRRLCLPSLPQKTLVELVTRIREEDALPEDFVVNQFALTRAFESCCKRVCQKHAFNAGDYA